MKQVKKGFTLIELLVVVAIIAILAAIAIPQFAKYREKAFNSSAESDLRNLKTAMESIYADNQSYPDISGGCAAGPQDNVTISNVTIPGSKISKGVTICLKSDNSTYSAAAKHINGSKIYLTTQDGNITSKDGTVGKVITDDNGTES